MTIKCIAADDEPLALDIIKDYALKIPFLNLVKTFKDGISTLEYLSANKVDLIFLDIEMGDISGMQMLKSLEHRPKVIMTTAYRNYAADAFDLNVTDYLLKPFSFERFLKAVEKASSLINSEKTEFTDIQTEKKFFFVKSDGKILKINFDDILYIEGLSEYIVIKTVAGNVITLMSFKNIEDVLPKNMFARIHKSYMIPLDKIESIKGQSVFIAKKELPIGNKYKKDFLSLISFSGKQK